MTIVVSYISIFIDLYIILLELLFVLLDTNNIVNLSIMNNNHIKKYKEIESK
jgi:hypothetical protein